MGVLAVIKAWVTPPTDAARLRQTIDERMDRTERARLELDVRMRRLEAQRRVRERANRRAEP